MENGNNIIDTIFHYFLEKMEDYEGIEHTNVNSHTGIFGSCAIWWSQRVDNPKLKQRYLQYHIIFADGYATLSCYELYSRVFHYADPAFPDNLWAALPKPLSMPDIAQNPQAVSP